MGWLSLFGINIYCIGYMTFLDFLGSMFNKFGLGSFSCCPIITTLHTLVKKYYFLWCQPYETHLEFSHHWGKFWSGQLSYRSLAWSSFLTSLWNNWIFLSWCLIFLELMMNPWLMTHSMKIYYSSLAHLINGIEMSLCISKLGVFILSYPMTSVGAYAIMIVTTLSSMLIFIVVGLIFSYVDVLSMRKIRGS